MPAPRRSRRGWRTGGRPPMGPAGGDVPAPGLSPWNEKMKRHLAHRLFPRHRLSLTSNSAGRSIVPTVPSGESLKLSATAERPSGPDEESTRRGKPSTGSFSWRTTASRERREGRPRTPPLAAPGWSLLVATGRLITRRCLVGRTHHEGLVRLRPRRLPGVVNHVGPDADRVGGLWPERQIRERHWLLLAGRPGYGGGCWPGAGCVCFRVRSGKTCSSYHA
jgi:hypothetical protein